MKNNIILFILTGAVLLVLGFLAGSFLSQPRPEGDSPETVIAEWRGSATGTIGAVSPTSIFIESDGAQVAVILTPETEISRSNIDDEGVEHVTSITREDLKTGDRAGVAVVLANGQLRAEAIRVLETQ